MKSGTCYGISVPVIFTGLSSFINHGFLLPSFLYSRLLYIICILLLISLPLDITIFVSVPPEQIGEVGEDISYLCQVESNYTQGAPVWYDPIGRRIRPLDEG